MFSFNPLIPSDSKGSYVLKAAGLFNPSRPNPGRRKKIDLNFYFHLFLVMSQKVL